LVQRITSGFRRDPQYGSKSEEKRQAKELRLSLVVDAVQGMVEEKTPIWTAQQVVSAIPTAGLMDITPGYV